MVLRKRKFLCFLFLLTVLLLCNATVIFSEEKGSLERNVNYVAKLNKLTPPCASEDLNAESYYQKAYDLYVPPTEQIKTICSRVLTLGFSAEAQALLGKWIEQNSEALNQLKQGSQKPCYWAKYQGASVRQIGLPPLKKAKGLADTLCCRSKIEAVRTNFKAAFADLLDCYKFGMHCGSRKTLLEQLVGLSIRTNTAQTAFQIIGRDKPSSDILKYFQEYLEKFSGSESYIIDFTVEKYAFYEDIQGLFTDDGKGSGTLKKEEAELLKKSLPQLTEEQKQVLFKLDRQKTIELTEAIFEYLNKAKYKTPSCLHNQNEDITKVLDEMTKNNPFLHTFLPAADRIIETSFQTKAQTDALLTTLALLRYKADKGRFPHELGELISTGYLKNLPMDPYGKNEMVYKITGNDFLLYSLGADFRDEGGVPSNWGTGKEGGDQVFWPLQSQ